MNLNVLMVKRKIKFLIFKTTLPTLRDSVEPIKKEEIRE
jgi:hypothetical protein